MTATALVNRINSLTRHSRRVGLDSLPDVRVRIREAYLALVTLRRKAGIYL